MKKYVAHFTPKPDVDPSDETRVVMFSMDLLFGIGSDSNADPWGVVRRTMFDLHLGRYMDATLETAPNTDAEPTRTECTDG